MRFLKENKDEMELKLDNLSGQLKEKSKAYETLLLENRGISRRVDGDLSELRIQLRIKSEELERISNIYEETLTNLKSSKLENEMLRDKFNVLKAEYYKAELENKEEFVNMKSQLVNFFVFSLRFIEFRPLPKNNWRITRALRRKSTKPSWERA